MNFIHDSVSTLRIFTGQQTAWERTQLRLRYTKSAFWEVALQTRNLVVVFGVGATLPGVSFFGYSLYRMTAPGRVGSEQYALLKALSWGSGLACSAAFLPRSLRSIGKHLVYIYNPNSAMKAALCHKIVRLFKDAMKIVAIVMLVATPYLISSRVAQVLLLGMPL